MIANFDSTAMRVAQAQKPRRERVPSRTAARRLRVAVVNSNAVDVVDGVALTTRRLVQYLLEQGHEVAVFAPDGGRRAVEPLGDFHALPSIPFVWQPEYRFAHFGRRAKREVADFGPDIVHLTTPDWSCHRAMSWALKNNVPIVGAFHSNLVSYFEFMPGLSRLQRIGWRIMRRFYRRCDRTLVPTPSMAEELRSEDVTDRITLWSRGVDHHRFNPKWRSMEWRRQHGVADDEQLVLFVARLRWEKGLKFLAEVIQNLEASGVAHKTMIVGDGVGDSWLRKNLPNTIFTGGLFGEDLSRAFASADLFLYPSETETFGNVMLEAMSSGVPVVGADAPGTRSVVVDGASGLMCRPRDLDDFVHNTCRLLVDDSLRRQLGAGALEHSNAFRWDTAMQAVVDCYQDLVAQRQEAAVASGEPAAPTAPEASTGVSPAR